ncbi:MAG: phage tail tape measure protein [Syntrophobacteraceae bacterium]
MSTALKMALTFTAIDAASGVIGALKSRILGIGAAGKQVEKDFNSMVSNMRAGLKGLTATWMAFEKIKPMVSTAANVQEALLEMKMTLSTAGKNAGKLAEELERVERVADILQKKTPFSSLDIIKAETAFKKAGVDIKDITDARGAAYAAASLATIAGHGQTPESVADIMTHVAIPFHVRGAQYGEMANLFQKVITNSTLDLPGFGAGMANFGGIAHDLGLDMKGTAQALMTVGESVRNPDAAGTYLKNFLLAISAPTKGEKEAQEEAGLNFWNKGHHLKRWDQIIAELQKNMEGMSDAEKFDTLRKAFQMRGLEAVIPLVHEGMGSYRESGEKIASSGDIETKLGIALEGLNRNVTSLSGTMETAVSQTFKPMLASLTAVTEKANDMADAFGKFAGSHQKEFGWGEAAGAGGLGLLGLYSMFRISKGLMAGGRVLRFLGSNLGATGVGIAEGKAIQAASGVTPVFVTNWPGGGLGGGALGALGAAAEAALGVAVSGGIAAGFSVALPALIAGIMAAAGAAGAMEAGKAVSRWQVKLLSDDALHRKFAENDVMGGGAKSWQGRLMLGELADRSIHVDNVEADRRMDALNATLKERPNNITLNLSIDQSGRVTSSSNDANTTARINLKRGDFLPMTD